MKLRQRCWCEQLAYIKFIFFVFFPDSENGGNGLADKGLMGAMPLRILGLEPPLYTTIIEQLNKILTPYD